MEQGHWGADFLASLVVFLVALPLCMGISIASGMPPTAGIITGIIGGIVVGFLSGSPLQASGPAAGLSVLVLDLVHAHGPAMLGIIVLFAGFIQIIAGSLKLGQWFRAVSYARSRPAEPLVRPAAASPARQERSSPARASGRAGRTRFAFAA